MMGEQITVESLKALKEDRTDFGEPVYFMTGAQFSYCLAHLEDHARQAKRIEELEAQNERQAERFEAYINESADWLECRVKLEKVRGLPDRWRKTSRMKTQDYTDLCGAADELDAVLRNDDE